ncbi:MAG: DUF2442 domain-containing protein [Vulcanimicrobiaceae bacterium]
MNTPKARVDFPDAEIDAAIACNKLVVQRGPHAVRARYRAADDAIELRLSNGVDVAIPRKLLQGLQYAGHRDLEKLEVVGHGTDLHWPSLNVDHHVRGLLASALGTQRWMEQRRLAGSVSTPAKAAAARANGRKGGRPKTAKAKQ